MPKVAQLQADQRGAAVPAAEARPVRGPQTLYYAFLSYSHKDEELARWLQRELEDFQVPPALVGRLTANGVIPKRLTPIFRDEHELAAADDLSEEIESALAASECLIVLCSPHAARSRWTNAEIETFKRSRPDGCVLAAIGAGEPFASDTPGREAEECFPPALRIKFDRRGRPTAKRAEPLAADLRESGDERRIGVLKLIAGMLGIGLDELVQRETTRRHRRLAWLTAASIAGMALTSTLAVSAFEARDEADDQRREAEGLVAFMLGDLKDKLEPIGRLDALDGVGSRVLAYYSKQDASDLSDAALLQRSRALSLTAEVSHLRGDRDTAERLYRQAFHGTREAVQRNPEEPQRLFDHAQNVFWIGALARERGRAREAETAWREYKRLAVRMVELEPNNMKWRMENQNADTNLGTLLIEQRRFGEAGRRFSEALRGMQALAIADPSNREYQSSVAESMAWLADARMSEGRLAEAVAQRRQHIALLQRLLADGREDVAYRQMLVPAYRALGNLYSWTGQQGPAVEQLRLAVETAQRLIEIEPKNSQWIGSAARARLNLADVLITAGLLGQAAAQTSAACEAVAGLIQRDSSVQHWRAALRDCHLMRTRLALRSGAKEQALRHAGEALRAAQSVDSGDPAGDRFAVARAHRLLGDVQQARGDKVAAHAAWTKALAALPRGIAERPSEMNERAQTLERLGGGEEFRNLQAKLNAIGYNRTM